MKNLRYLLLGILIMITGCSHERTQPNIEYLPTLRRQPSYQAFEMNSNFGDGKTLQSIPQGSIPTDAQVYFPGDLNPVPNSSQVRNRGKVVFETFCILCHGQDGKGLGKLYPRYPQTPDLTSARVKGMSDGQIFQIISNGQRLMQPYAALIDFEDRWKVIHYLRALPRGEN